MIGIDTVSATITDCLVRDNHGFSIDPYNYREDRLENHNELLITEYGQVLPGFKGQASYKDFRFFCFPAENYKPRTLLVEFEVPTIYYGNNLNPTNLSQNKEVLNDLQEALDIIGVIAKPVNFKFVRIDLFKCIFTDYYIHEYSNLVNYWAYICSGHPEINNSSFCKRNNSYGIHVYDKEKQIQDDKGLFVNGLSGKNLTRVELRLFTKKYINKKLAKVGQKNKLSLIGTKKGLKGLNKLFKEILTDIFKADLSIGTEECKNDILKAKQLQMLGVRPSKIGELLTIGKHAHEGNLEELIRNVVGDNARKQSVYRDRVKKEILKYDLYSSDDAKKYQELKSKLLNPKYDIGHLEVRQSMSCNYLSVLKNESVVKSNLEAI